MCVCVCTVYMFVPWRDRKMAQDPLKLEVRMVLSHCVGCELLCGRWDPARAVFSLTC